MVKKLWSTICDICKGQVSEEAEKTFTRRSKRGNLLHFCSTTCKLKDTERSPQDRIGKMGRWVMREFGKEVANDWLNRSFIAYCKVYFESAPSSVHDRFFDKKQVRNDYEKERVK